MSRSVWSGFTLQMVRSSFSRTTKCCWISLRNTLIIAVIGGGGLHGARHGGGHRHLRHEEAWSAPAS
jgi:hypothetical protein